jgi:LAS superfamily LD-carboxypeptidase LdcB
MCEFDEWELTGHARTHVLQYAAPRFAALPEVGAAFLAMRGAALQDGIDILPCASYRPFEAQVRIWNKKFSGQAPLYDMHGRERDRAVLAPPEIVLAILGWSGIPGASRRHWGTDIDVFDRAAKPPGYRVKLLPEEVAPGGVFVSLHRWLDAEISRFGFFRPYRTYRSGMYPEPWHLSHVVCAQAALGALDVDMVARAVRGSDMLGRELVLEMLPELYRTHVLDIDPPD